MYKPGSAYYKEFTTANPSTGAAAGVDIGAVTYGAKGLTPPSGSAVYSPIGSGFIRGV